MILRRLGERLRQQDWFAVTIELALVVAGVFLGIQVANWNEERKARSTEAARVDRMLEPPAATAPAMQLEQELPRIAERYDLPTARLVALVMEYPWAAANR